MAARSVDAGVSHTPSVDAATRASPMRLVDAIEGAASTPSWMQAVFPVAMLRRPAAGFHASQATSLLSRRMT
jgi:hypothetical protein